MAHDFDTLIDLDGNGAMDLLTTHQELGPSIVQWHTGEEYRYGRSEVLVDALAGELLTNVVHLDADGDLDLISAVQASGNVFWFENQGRMIRPGDANQNGRFERLDPVAVLQAGKYRTGQTATWDEGDWNGDRRFDSLDVVVALDTKQLSGRFE